MAALHRLPPCASRVCSGCGVFAALSLHWPAACAGDSIPPDVINVALRSDTLPTPLGLVRNGVPIPVISFELRGRIVAGEDAKGLLTLNTGRPTVNEWGDVIEVKARAAPTSTVALREVRTPQIDSKAQGGPFPSSKDVKGDLYDIVPDADAVQAKLRLVLSTAAYGPPMLIFQGGGPPGQESSPLQLLALSGQPELKEALPDPPVDSKLVLAGLSPVLDGGASSLRRVTLRGSRGGKGELQLDPNRLIFDTFGDVIGSTLIYRTPLACTIQRTETPDPAKSGRQLYEIIPEAGAARRYHLVVAPSEAGGHRLLVRDKDTLEYILPLHDPRRRSHMQMLALLEKVSEADQKAVVQLRSAIHYDFLVRAEAEKVIELVVTSPADAARVDPMLKQLPHLKKLQFQGSKLTAACLRNLRNLLNSAEPLACHAAPRRVLHPCDAERRTTVPRRSAACFSPMRRGASHYGQLNFCAPYAEHQKRETNKAA